MQAHKLQVLLIACAIGALTNFPVSIGENYIIYATECNGMQDAYWVCNNATLAVGGTTDVTKMDLTFRETWGIATVEPGDTCGVSSLSTLVLFCKYCKHGFAEPLLLLFFNVLSPF